MRPASRLPYTGANRMQGLQQQRGTPLTVAVIGVVLSFAVVCPLMAAPGVPSGQACHGAESDLPEERLNVCCASVTVPTVAVSAPVWAAELAAPPNLAGSLPDQGSGSAVARLKREMGPPLFLRHASLRC